MPPPRLANLYSKQHIYQITETKKETITIERTITQLTIITVENPVIMTAEKTVTHTTTVGVIGATTPMMISVAALIAVLIMMVLMLLRMKASKSSSKEKSSEKRH